MVIESERLRLRFLEKGDAKEVQRLAGDHAIADTTCRIPHPYEDGVAEEWIARQEAEREEGTSLNFAITHKESGELLGVIGLMGIVEGHKAELGYWIGKAFWGKGYASEAGGAVRDDAFVRFRLERLFAQILARNPASGRVLEKIGMQQEGLLRGHVQKWGLAEDVIYFGLMRAEWEALCG